MSYDKADFVLVKRSSGKDVLVNIPKITFIVESHDNTCKLYFSGDDDDYIIVEGNIEDIMEIL
jgi:hypothetical protein